MSDVQVGLRQRAGAIIIRDGSVLLIHRHRHGNEYYVLPGGGIEEGESPEEAVIRELREEAGVDIRVGDLLNQSVNLDCNQYQYFFACTLIENGKRPEWQERDRVRSDNQYWFEWIDVDTVEQCPLQPDWIKPVLLANGREVAQPGEIAAIDLLGIAKLIVGGVPEVSSVYLYGSQIHKLKNKQSDIDLFVVLRTLSPEALDNIRRIVLQLKSEVGEIGITLHARSELLLQGEFPSDTFIHRNRTWFFLYEMRLQSRLLWGEDIFPLLPLPSRTLLVPESARILKSLAYEARKKLVNKYESREDRIDVVKYALYGSQYVAYSLGSSYCTAKDALGFLRGKCSADIDALADLLNAKAGGFLLSEAEWQVALDKAIRLLELFAETATANHYAIKGARTVLFDGYGLLYSWPARQYEAALTVWEKRHGLEPLGKEEWRHIKSRAQKDAGFYREWKSKRFGTYQQAFEEFDHAWVQAHTALHEGAKRVLETLTQQGKELVLVTDTVHSRERILEITDALEISRYFSAIHVSSEEHAVKDDGALFSKILPLYSPSNTLFFGHDAQELQAASRAGYFPMAIGCEAGNMPLRSYISDDLGDLPF